MVIKMKDNIRKGVVLVFADGEVMFCDNKDDKRHHDDILWNMLSQKNILPDSYKNLTSRNENLEHDLSSLGFEAMMAASNGMIVMFLVYDSDIEYNHAIVYLPEKFTDEQVVAFADFLSSIHSKEPVDDYYVGTIISGKSYEEVDDIEYRPDYTDEFIYNSLTDFMTYIKNYNSKLHR